MTIVRKAEINSSESICADTAIGTSQNVERIPIPEDAESNRMTRPNQLITVHHLKYDR